MRDELTDSLVQSSIDLQKKTAELLEATLKLNKKIDKVLDTFETAARAIEMFARAVLKASSKLKKASPVVEFDFSKYKRPEVKPVQQQIIIQQVPVRQVVDYKSLIQAPVKTILPNLKKPEA